MPANMIAVVLSGGSGTRLWPNSRESHPKPFIKMPDGETLIEKTYGRVKSLGLKMLTVTNREYYFMSRDKQERLAIEGCFLLEPFGRNTASAVALAAKYIVALHGSDTIMLILPADHLIVDQEAFKDSVLEASNLAEDGFLVTFGIVPTAPQTGYGYIEKGPPLGAGYRVARFVEKPNLEIARSYLESGSFLWNSGMFCFKAGVFLNELEIHAKEIATNAELCWQAMQPINELNLAEIPDDVFKKMPSTSIDYAIMEKSDNVAVIRSDFGWNDIGSWTAIRDLIAPDFKLNRTSGASIFFETENTFVQSANRLVATMGVRDLMIIDTPDALLVMHQDKAQDVKHLVEKLKSENNDVYKTNRTVNRPWGSYTVLEESPGFKIKRIEVKPGESLSLQMHRHRSEHWVVVSGNAKITNGDKVVTIKANESTFIPAGQKHRLENPGSDCCVIIEVQCGKYLGEDDIVRFEDQYGR